LLNSLQAGRAVAAISVAAFHLSGMMGETRYGGEAVFREYTSRGYLGVDFFFVLSGFIILFGHGADIGRPGAWAGYLWRRIVRLFPIYWLYTAVFATLVALGVGTAAELPGTALDYLTTFSLIRFTDVVPPLPVAWSLYHELAFYLAFALLIVDVRLGLVAFAAGAIAAFANFHYPYGDFSPQGVYTAASNLYFLFGMGSCLLYRRGGSGVPDLVAGCCLMLVGAIATGQEHELGPLVLAAGFAFALAGLAKLELTGKLFVPAGIAFVGDATYSIYLLHESISGLLLKVLIYTGLRDRLGGETAWFIVLAATIALGCVAYAFVEKPLTRMVRTLPDRWRTPTRPAGPRGGASQAK
jgi:exopolysaccharide production protein ExoZ